MTWEFKILFIKESLLGNQKYIVAKVFYLFWFFEGFVYHKCNGYMLDLDFSFMKVATPKK